METVLVNVVDFATFAAQSNCRSGARGFRRSLNEMKIDTRQLCSVSWTGRVPMFGPITKFELSNLHAALKRIDT